MPSSVSAFGSSGAPKTASYLALSTDSLLSNERVLTAGTNVSFVDGGAGSTLTINANDSTGITSINGDTAVSQTIVTASTGTDISIATTGGVTTVAIPSASATNRGLLTSADWSDFDGKEGAITATTTADYYRGDKTFQTLNGLAVTNTPAGNIAAVTVQAALNELDTEKEPSVTAGTSAQYYRGDKTFQTLDTLAVPENTNLYLTNARVIGSTITGFTSGAGTLAATDTVLEAIEKLDGNINASVSGVSSVFGRSGAVVSASGDYTATQVTNTPAGSLSSITVQGAVNELDSEKAAISGQVFTGAISATNLSGTNTGDQTITLTGDVTGSGTGSFATTLANSGVTANTYGSSSLSPVFAVDAKGRVTAVTDTAIDHDALTNFVANEHIDHSSVAISAGTGLTGGGDITTTRTLTVDIATGANIAASTANKIVDASAVVDEDTMTSNSDQKLPTQQSVKAYVDTQIGTLASALKYRGSLSAGSDITGTSTGNSYVDSGVDYKVGDYFKITSTGNITVSNGTIAVTLGDSLVINSTVAHASIVIAGVDVLDAGDAVSSVYGRVGTVTAQSGDYTASQVTNTPAGSIVATTVQGAIDELEGDKLSTSLPTGEIYIGSAGGVATAVPMSGDATIASGGALTLANTAVTAGSYGSGTQVGIFTVDAKGRLTTAANTTISAITLATGTTGSDVNFSAGTVSPAGTLTLNIPDASATARGLVTAGAQTFAGAKTLTSTLTAVAINPTTDNTYDLGTTALRWKSIHVGPGSFIVHDDATNTDYGELKYTTGTGVVLSSSNNGTINIKPHGSGGVTIGEGSTGAITICGVATSSLVIAGGGSTTISIGASQTSGAITLGNSSSGTSTLTLGSGGATVITAGGTMAITGSSISLTGATSVTGILNVSGLTTLAGNLGVNGGSITTSATTVNLVNGTATTINFGGAATTVLIGSTTGTTTVQNSLSVMGSATIGDASGDTVTINASTVSVPNSLNFDSNTLYIDATNNRIGINTNAPSNPLHVVRTSGSGGVITVENTGTGSIGVILPSIVSPEGTVTADPGDLAIGSTTGRLYVKRSGTGTNTGWGDASSTFIGGNSTATTAATQYIGVYADDSSATEVNVHAWTAPFTGVIRNLRAKVLVAPGVGDTWTFTVRVNAAATSVTAAITGAVQTTATDTTNSVSVTAGDLICCEMLETGACAATRAAWSAEYYLT